VALIALLLGFPLLALAPAALGAVRLAGVGLLWWYAVLVAPLVAVAIATALLLADRG
jgi:hypothetical protein